MTKHRSALLFFTLVVAFEPVYAQTPEYEVKAVIIERLTNFVDWPEESFEGIERDSFVVGVFGQNPFGSILEEMYSDVEVSGRPVTIRHFADTSELSGCQVLFIGETENATLADVLAHTRERAVLTISDREGFAELGVLVNLELAGSRVQLVINETAVRQSGLRMSHHLLNMARIVSPYEGST